MTITWQDNKLVAILQHTDEDNSQSADRISEIMNLPKRRIREIVLKLNSTPEAPKIASNKFGYFIPRSHKAKRKMLQKQKRALMREVRKYKALKHDLENEGNQKLKGIT